MKSIHLHCLIPLCFLFLSAALSVLADDITVDSNCSLTDAIHAAQSDSEVGGCPAGNGADAIHLSGDITLAAELPQITSDITIKGGGFTISGDNAFRIFYIAEGALTLNRLTLTDGSADYGGAIHNDGVLTISDSNFSNNAAEYVGGAIFSAGMLSIIDSRFDNNQATLDGGAIISDGTLNITSSRFTNNLAGRFVGVGGAIANYGKLNIVDSSFSNNSAGIGGGAISSKEELNISDSSFTKNSAVDGEGGAIENIAGQLSIVDSSFSGNSADRSGGAIDNHTPFEGRLAQLSVANSIFTENQTERSGGAINNSGEANIVGSSFEDNLARLFGGAIANYGALNVANSTLFDNIGIERGGGFNIFGNLTTTLQHLTVANNLSKEGGGIYVYRQEQEGTVVNLSNSLIFGNDGGDCSAHLNLNSGNLIADGSCDPALSGDPLLGTLVEPEDGSPAYYPLLPDSPAIDAADPDFCTEADQTGAARPQGDGCDIGAYEYMSD